MNTHIKNNIMRRVYYAYAVHMVSRPIVRRGVPLALLAFFLGSFVSFQHVLTNVMHMQLASLPAYLLSAFTHTETYTLLIVAAILFIVFRSVLDVFSSYSFKIEPVRA